jgi:hypothetical protein
MSESTQTAQATTSEAVLNGLWQAMKENELDEVAAAATSTRKVGDLVFDGPSQGVRRIVSVSTEVVDGKVMTFYEVDAPADPTLDGAFPDGWRNSHEVCDQDKTIPLLY